MQMSFWTVGYLQVSTFIPTVIGYVIFSEEGRMRFIKTELSQLSECYNFLVFFLHFRCAASLFIICESAHYKIFA